MPELRRFSMPMDRAAREPYIKGTSEIDEAGEHASILGDRTMDVAVVDDLMDDAAARWAAGEWGDDRAGSDGWLAPRLHWALRIGRADAADRGVWLWLALRYPDYLRWRWSADGDEIAEDRWYGPIHKQALARLWWGAELFRDGPDYRTVRRAFHRQDLPNSYLHRPLVRCRSLALGLLDVLVPSADDAARSAREVNDLARVLNLATGGSPPEIETDFQQDDRAGFLRWSSEQPVRPDDWHSLPAGPDVEDTTPHSRAGGAVVASRGWTFAQQARDQTPSS